MGFLLCVGPAGPTVRVAIVIESAVTDGTVKESEGAADQPDDNRTPECAKYVEPTRVKPTSAPNAVANK